MLPNRSQHRIASIDLLHGTVLYWIGLYWIGLDWIGFYCIVTPGKRLWSLVYPKFTVVCFRASLPLASCYQLTFFSTTSLPPGFNSIHMTFRCSAVYIGHIEKSNMPCCSVFKDILAYMNCNTDPQARQLLHAIR